MGVGMRGGLLGSLVIGIMIIILLIGIILIFFNINLLEAILEGIASVIVVVISFFAGLVGI